MYNQKWETCVINKNSGYLTSIHLHVNIWNNIENSGLYSFKAHESEKIDKSYHIKNNHFFFGLKKSGDISFNKDFLQYIEDQKIKLQFLFDKEINLFMLKSIQENKIQNYLWCCQKDIAQRQWVLEENQFLKLGKQILKITKIKPKQFKRNSESIQNLNRNFSTIKSSSSSLNQAEKVCRICLEKETNLDPFDKALCLCSQNMPCHILCLQKWLSSKILKIDKEKVKYWNLVDLCCDICKTKYPFSFVQDEIEYKIFELEYDKYDDFVQMDVYSCVNHDLQGVLRILGNSLDKEVIKLGRSLNNEVCFKDISVSRIHALIYKKKQQWIIKDNNSKFGTLLKVPKRILFQDFKDLFILQDKFCFDFHNYRFKKCCKLSKNQIFEDTKPHYSIPLSQEYFKIKKKQQLQLEKLNTIQEVTENSFQTISDSNQNQSSLFRFSKIKQQSKVQKQNTKNSQENLQFSQIQKKSKTYQSNNMNLIVDDFYNDQIQNLIQNNFSLDQI